MLLAPFKRLDTETCSVAIHHFCTEDAGLYGIEEAIILQNIGFWCCSNLANRINIHDGRVWTYNTRDAFLELFPYLVKSGDIKARRIKIGRILNSLEDQGAIVSDQLNKSKHDRTKYYSLADISKLEKYGKVSLQALSLLKEQICSIEDSDMFHRCNDSVLSLTDKKQHITTTTEVRARKNSEQDFEVFYFCLVNVLTDMISEGGWISSKSKKPTKSWLMPKAKGLFERLPFPDPADCAVLVLRDWSKLVSVCVDQLPVVTSGVELLDSVSVV